MRLADAIVQTLKQDQTDTVFGICGGYLFWLLRAFEQAGIRTIPSRHEGAAAFVAAGYAQASGRIGVVFGQGPGATNTMTGVACAYYDSTPLLVIASQAPQDHYAADAHQEATGSNFGIDQLAAFRTLTRAAFRVPSAASSIRTLRRALAIAHGDRGPTMIEFPANLLGEEIDHDPQPPQAYRSVPRRVDTAGIAELVELVAAAKRPVLLIGNRATHRGIADDLRALCEENTLPFAATDFAKGIIPEDHPLYLGVIGWCGHEAAHASLASADLVITIGARLDSKSTVNYDRSMFTNLVQIDEEPSEIGRNMPVRLGVIGEIPATVRALRDALRARHVAPVPIGQAPAWIAENHRQYHTFEEPLATDPNRFGSANAMHVLREHLPRTALLVGDSGLNLHYFKRFFPVHAPDGFFCFYGWAAMGSGLPVAIGVQIARPDDLVVCVIGDGGLLVYAGELQVMAEYNLPVVCIVLNNAGYQQVNVYMSKLMASSYGCAIKEIDAARIAESFGCDGYTARSVTELGAAIDQAVERRRPAIIDVKVSGDLLDDVMLPSVERFVNKVYARKQ
jgi:acetolactate synthase-1/2/3 large subunit